MLNFPLLLETGEPETAGLSMGDGALNMGRPQAAPRGLDLFLDVLDAHLARRRAEEAQAREREQQDALNQASQQARAQATDLSATRAPDVPTQPFPNQAALQNARATDFAMYKLHLAMLLRMGGPAPVAEPETPGSSAAVREALKVWRSGSRRAFARDSDLFSAPRFPVTRFKNPG